MPAEPRVVVYKATNLTNGKFYIGYTGRGLSQREKAHRYTARGTAPHGLLHRALCKYGDASIVFEVLADFAGDEDMAKLFECEAIAAWKPAYNLTYGGEGGTLAEESRAKIGAANRGRKRTEEFSERQRALMTGRKHTLETRAKITAANIGRPSSMLGRPVSAETRAKLSAANKGQVPWTTGKQHSAETKAKMSAWQVGRVLPDEHRANISRARKEAWAANRDKYLQAALAGAARGQAARRIAVRCVEDGNVFEGCSDADRYYGFRSGKVSHLLKGTVNNNTGLTFVRIVEE